VKVALILDPETGFRIESHNSDYERWQREFPNQIRITEIPEALMNRFNLHKAEGSILHSQLSAYFSDLNGLEQ
jgi:hypothetical protein